LSQKHRFIKDL